MTTPTEPTAPESTSGAGAAADLSRAAASGNGRNATDGPVGGRGVSGVFPNRSYATAPDIEQKKRQQARDESNWARGGRTTHPTFTKNQYDTNPGVVGESNRTRAEAEAAGDLA